MSAISTLYRMLDTARKNHDRATELLVQARLLAAWSAPTIARLRDAASNRIASGEGLTWAAK